MLKYQPSPTGEAFVQSDKYIKLIEGPVGGGKSTVCLNDLWTRAFRQKPNAQKQRRTRFIILRNTMAQLKSTVKPLIDQWMVAPYSGKLGRWRLSENTFEITARLSDGTDVFSEFVMMAADTPDDVRRLLSLECSAAWVEECREVDPEVFDGLIGRVNRFPNRDSGGVTYPGVICSTNPPPLETFWHDKIANPPSNWGVFIQPAALMDDGSINPDAENLKHLNPGYYENLMEGKSSAWIDVYLKNKFGSGGFGNPVFRSTFKREFHVAATSLKVIPTGNNKIIIGSDNGRTAAAVIGQQDALGRINLIADAYVPDGDNMSYERFLDDILIPKLNGMLIPRKDVLFVVDPACFTRAEASDVTIAQVISQRGFDVIRANTNVPELRLGACEQLLLKQMDGGPGLRISPDAKHITAALDYGYRYKKATAAGGEPQIDKNHFSHVGDAFNYFCLYFTQGLVSRNTRAKARTVTKSAYAYA